MSVLFLLFIPFPSFTQVMCFLDCFKKYASEFVEEMQIFTDHSSKSID